MSEDRSSTGKPLIEDPLFMAADRVMHEIWSWTVDKPGYRADGIKQKWFELEAAITALARR